MITILIPCLNEEKFIEACLTSVMNFEIPPGQAIEVLVLDGGSIDRTRVIVSRVVESDPRFVVIDNPGRIQSCGLNIGLKMSRGEWILRLDAHSVYPSDYLRLCYETAIRTGADNVGGLWVTLPGGEGYEAQIVQALSTHPFGVGDSGFRTGCGEGVRDTVPFGFFRRSVFGRIGYFDERLVRTQDYEFNSRLRASGGTIYLNPSIRCYYHHLADLRSLYSKQLLRQGPYSVYMWYVAPYSFAARHAVTACFAVFFYLCIVLSFFSAEVGLVFAGVIGFYFFLAFLASIQQALRYRRLRHMFVLPLCFFFFHMSHGTGALIGLIRILTGTAPVQATTEPWAGAGKCRSWP